jgi:Tfp pilus assembly protein PilN
MRPVNLLPERYRPARPSGRLRGSAYVTVGALVVLLAMVFFYVNASNQIKTAQDETNKAMAEAQAAEARATALGAFGDFQQIKATRETAVKALALTRFDYERMMREMALVLPKGVFLTTFDATATGEQAAAPGGVTATGPSLGIGGCAPSHRDVATTVVRLRRLHNAVDVNLNGSTKGGAGTSGGGCKVSWSVLIRFKAEAVPETRPPVPTRLGGGA